MIRCIFYKAFHFVSILFFISFFDFVFCSNEYSMDMNYTGVSERVVCSALTQEEVDDVFNATVSSFESKDLTPEELECVYKDIMYSLYPRLSGESFKIAENEDPTEDAKEVRELSAPSPKSLPIYVQESLESRLDIAKSNMSSSRITIIQSPILKLIDWIDKSEQFFEENDVNPEDSRALEAFHERWHDERKLRKRAKKLLGKQGRKWFEKQLCEAAVTARQIINQEVENHRRETEEQKRQAQEKDEQKKEILKQLEFALDKKQQEKVEKARLELEEKQRIEFEKRELLEKKEVWYASQIKNSEKNQAREVDRENLEEEIKAFYKTKKHVEFVKDRRTRGGGSVRCKLISLALCQIESCENELAYEEYEQFYVDKMRLISTVETISQSACSKRKTYTISDELKEQAGSWGLKLDSLESMHANHIQHYIYQEAVGILNETASIKSAFYDVSDIAKTTEIVVCSLDYAIECAREHEYKKSFDLIDLASGIFDIAKGTAMGFFYLTGRVMKGMDLGGKDIGELFGHRHEPVSFLEAIEHHSREVLNTTRDFLSSVAKFLTKIKEQPIVESIGDSLEFLSRSLTKVAIAGGIVVGAAIAVEAGAVVAASIGGLSTEVLTRVDAVVVKELLEPFTIKVEADGLPVVALAKEGSAVLEKATSAVAPVCSAIATPLAQVFEKLYGFSSSINNFLFAMQGSGDGGAGKVHKNISSGSSVCYDVGVADEEISIIEEHLKSVDALDVCLNRLSVKRLKSGNMTINDMCFVKHELLEAKLVSQGISQTVAHDMALKQLGHSPWQIYGPEVVAEADKLMGVKTMNPAYYKFWGIE